MKIIRRNIYIITFVIIIILSIIIIIRKNKLVNNNYIVESNIVKENEEIIEEYIYVDIKGEVNNPNVYKVNNNLRVIDIINLAGGLTENADTSNINLSKIVTDEMVIVIKNKEDFFYEKQRKRNHINSVDNHNNCNVNSSRSSSNSSNPK